LISEPGIPHFRQRPPFTRGHHRLLRHTLHGSSERPIDESKVRRWLVEKIASEKPAAIVINGDLPDDQLSFQVKDKFDILVKP
jgi:hypothetical protein